MSGKTTSHPEPTRAQLRVFAVLLPVFFLLLGLMAMRRPQGLLVAAGFCGVATIAAVALDSSKRAAYLVGLAIPLALMLIVLPVRMGVNSRLIAAACVVIGVLLGVVVLLSPPSGRAVYDFWMRAAEPIGYTLSLLMLTLAYFLVFFPVGLLMRLLGKDPLDRAFDRQAKTYWIAHNPEAEPERYFKQF